MEDVLIDLVVNTSHSMVWKINHNFSMFPPVSPQILINYNTTH